ncbi:aldehyde dehydrogenase family protein [Amycolatopsis sp. cmx-4-54]|uniref:aldehyde dehydrogenase family protein n=1 Tax=Amycolatopsis sp. cmx-4-54 TaxID=2790936 RepID=UPI00397B058B
MINKDSRTVVDELRDLFSTCHHDRPAALLGDGTVVVGGQADRDEKYIAPTVLTGVSPDAPVMRDEIFGPILPIADVADVDAALAFVNERDKPLALYAFTESEETKRRIETETSSGGLVFGAKIIHLAAPELPFGGVGESGMSPLSRALLDRRLQPWEGRAGQAARRVSQRPSLLPS